MGLSLAGATAIAAGAGALGTGAQMMMTGKMNNKTREWNEKMMHRQRDWALADYSMQNEYNSPRAQMARLKEAGLNPNLVYGNGADAQGGVIRSTDTPQWKPETPNVQGFAHAAQQGLATYYDLQQQQAQTNLLKTQNTIAERDAQMRQIQMAAQTLGIVTGTWKLQQSMKMAPYQLSMLKEQVGKTQQEIMESLSRMSESSWRQNTGSTRLWQEGQRLGMDKSRLESDLQTADLQRMLMRVSANKSNEEINQLRENINNLKKTGKWQDYENEIFERLKKLNLSPSDPAYYKLITATAEKLGRK